MIRVNAESSIPDSAPGVGSSRHLKDTYSDTVSDDCISQEPEGRARTEARGHNLNHIQLMYDIHDDIPYRDSESTGTVQ